MIVLLAYCLSLREGLINSSLAILKTLALGIHGIAAPSLTAKVIQFEYEKTTYYGSYEKPNFNNYHHLY